MHLGLWLGAGALGALAAARVAQRAKRRFDFRDKVALITGGSRGLGLVLARELTKRGARVALTARDTEELGHASDELTRHGGNVLAVPCDLADPAEIDEMVGAVLAHFGRVDVLVNCAGIVQVGPAETMTLVDFEQAMRVHFWGPWHVTSAVLPQMRRRGAGRIINIASIGGRIAVPHVLPYTTSKFALVGFSRGLRAELLRDGIYVTTVCPGLLRTGSVTHAAFKGRANDEYRWFTVSSVLPVLSMEAPRAARRILSAAARGRSELVLTLPARLAALLQAAAPGCTTDALAWVNEYLLPAPGGLGARELRGDQTAPGLVPLWAKDPMDRAARENNELVTPSPPAPSS